MDLIELEAIIETAIEENKGCFFGLRIEGFIPKIDVIAKQSDYFGDEFNEDGSPRAGEQHNGTSAIEIDPEYKNRWNRNISLLDQYRDNVLSKSIVLWASEKSNGSGEDEGEILLKDPICIAVWKIAG